MMLLDSKFQKVVALMRSTVHAGERQAARSRAEAMAAAVGMTLEEALAAGSSPTPGSIFKGFDDRMEAARPGWEAERAAERLVKVRAWKARRTALVAKYGSLEAAIAPCERETSILAAVARWRTVRDDARWTHALDRWSGHAFAARAEAPTHVVEAIVRAYPLPTTFAEARAEHDHWTDRNQELEDALWEGGDAPGNDELDLPTAIRAEIIRDLAEHELPVTILVDLHARFQMYRQQETRDAKVEAALFRDVAVLAQREAKASTAFEPAAPSPIHQAGQVRDVLETNPEWSDRRIAQKIGCSPTTVGKIRRAIGATATVRSVQRGGQVYRVRIGSIG